MVSSFFWGLLRLILLSDVLHIIVVSFLLDILSNRMYFFDRNQIYDVYLLLVQYNQIQDLYFHIHKLHNNYREVF